MARQPLPDVSFERETTAARLAATIRDLILSGELEAGAPLREVELSSKSGASRVTVREALQRLVHEGVAVHNPHRGVAVVELGESDIKEIFGARRVLETAAVHHSPQAPAEKRELLVATAESFASDAAAGESWDALANVDAEFHCSLVDLLGQPRLTRLERSLLVELRIALAMVDRRTDDHDAQAEDHLAIANEVAAGNVDAAIERLERHLDAAANRVLAVIQAAA